MNRRPPRCLVLITACTAAAFVPLLILSGTAYAADFEHWIAISNTAISITGDIEFSPSRMFFANHAVLPLIPAGSAIGFTWIDSMRDQPAKLYRIPTGTNPKLLNDNFLCGANIPPSFISVIEHGGDVYLTVFSGGTTPTPKDFAARICAGLAYSLK